MIRTNLEAVLMSQFYVTLILAVNIVTTFGSLEIDIGHLSIVSYLLPKHISLIVAHIYAMYVLAGVFTFGLGMCGKCTKYR